MAEQSNIEWCDGTFNPWIGCTKVSPGCANCYAANSTRARVLRAGGQETWGKGAPRSRTKTWGDPLKWNKAAAGAARRPRIFCASLADWLDDEVPLEWLADLLDLIRNTPNLDWLLLTKRPQNFRPRLQAILAAMGRILTLEEAYLRTFVTLMLEGWESSTYTAPEVGRENYWIGTTCEDQARANERIPALLKIPASVRFLSCEPLLGPVNFNLRPEVMAGGYNALRPYRPTGCTSPEQPRIHWVIGGGESGSGARAMHPEWARGLRDQCQAAGVPFLFKQWGEFAPGKRERVLDDPKKNGQWTTMTVLSSTDKKREGAKVLYAHDSEGAACRMDKPGKKKAGRELDGQTWDEFPEVVTV